MSGSRDTAAMGIFSGIHSQQDEGYICILTTTVKEGWMRAEVGVR